MKLAVFIRTRLWLVTSIVFNSLKKRKNANFLNVVKN